MTTENETQSDGDAVQATGAPHDLVDWPSECPNCGGAVDYGTTEDNRSIVLCKGDCGNWGYVYDGE